MMWYHYLAAFGAGAFITNSVPHFVNGISGDRFPTPFARPHGRGLSSPLLNVVWALVNLAVGLFLLSMPGVDMHDVKARLLVFAAVALLSLAMAKNFSGKHKD
jgi:hypothetical protein